MDRDASFAKKDFEQEKFLDIVFFTKVVSLGLIKVRNDSILNCFLYQLNLSEHFYIGSR